MFTIYSANAKKYLLVLGLVIGGLACGSAMAGELGAAKSGKPYQEYAENQDVEMIDAIDHDYPVAFSGTHGRTYLNYGGEKEIDMVDAIDKNEPVVPTEATLAGVNPYVKIDGDRDIELIDALDRAQ